MPTDRRIEKDNLMKLLPVLVLTLLAACGAAGAPERPAPGITLSGEAKLGVQGTM